MLRIRPALPGHDVDLGQRAITPEDIRRYARAIGDDELADGPCTVAPLGFALDLRGGPVPDIELDDDTVSVHGGHVITVTEPLSAPATYHLRARIADIFEKSGRSGPLTVIARRAEITDHLGRCHVAIEDHQIVRRRRTAPVTAAIEAPSAGDSALLPTASAGEETPEVGAVITLAQQAAPGPTAVDAYASRLGAGEPLFQDRSYAQALGYADVIVPGPLQSALVERLLRHALPAWQPHRLSMTFRVSVIAGEPIVASAAVVEHHLRADAESLVLDLWLENGASDRATIGTVELRRVDATTDRRRSGRV